jgi:hypothetical protein
MPANNLQAHKDQDRSQHGPGISSTMNETYQHSAQADKIP